MSCQVFQRIVDDRSSRMVEEPTWTTEDDCTPAAAFSAFIDAEEPPAGTYRVDAGHRGCVTFTYEGPSR
jgi:hypothetical protein